MMGTPQLLANFYRQKAIKAQTLIKLVAPLMAAAKTLGDDASIVTGRGVQALMGGFDSQVKAAQAVFARFLVNLIGIAFEADEKIFANDRKTIRGSDDGTPYELTYTPARDIKGDYTVDVQFLQILIFVHRKLRKKDNLYILTKLP